MKDEKIKKTGKRTSILDYHIDEIKKLREMDLNAMAIYKIIRNKVPGKLSYNGVNAYLKRNKL